MLPAINNSNSRSVFHDYNVISETVLYNGTINLKLILS
jgi:hypothetical protein